MAEARTLGKRGAAIFPAGQKRDGSGHLTPLIRAKAGIQGRTYRNLALKRGPRLRGDERKKETGSIPIDHSRYRLNLGAFKRRLLTWALGLGPVLSGISPRK